MFGFDCNKGKKLRILIDQNQTCEQKFVTIRETARFLLAQSFACPAILNRPSSMQSILIYICTLSCFLILLKNNYNNFLNLLISKYNLIEAN